MSVHAMAMVSLSTWEVFSLHVSLKAMQLFPPNSELKYNDSSNYSMFHKGPAILPILMQGLLYKS